jgi:hypothetical protein
VALTPFSCGTWADEFRSQPGESELSISLSIGLRPDHRFYIARECTARLTQRRTRKPWLQTNRPPAVGSNRDAIFEFQWVCLLWKTRCHQPRPRDPRAGPRGRPRYRDTVATSSPSSYFSDHTSHHSQAGAVVAGPASRLFGGICGCSHWIEQKIQGATNRRVA